MMKKLISIVLAIVSICCVIPFAYAGEIVPSLLSDSNTLVEGACPTTGDAGVLTIAVTFKNLEPVDKTSIEKINNRIYSTTYDYNIPSNKVGSIDDSLHSFFFRQSFGKLNIVGKAFDYTTQHDYTYYLPESGNYQTCDDVVEEAINYYTSTGEFNMSDYDKNNDGFIDSVILYARNIKVGNSYIAYIGSVSNCYPALSGKKFKYVANVSYIGGSNNFVECSDRDCNTYNCLIYHEFFHTFGIGDVYGGTGVNPSSESGVASLKASTIHDSNSTNGVSAPHKILLGWANVSNITTGTYNIGSSTSDDTVYVLNKGNQIFVIEYCSKKNNRNRISGISESSCEAEMNGLRIWKVEWSSDPRGTSKCWIRPFNYIVAVNDNIGEIITVANSTEDSRSIRLVNVGEYVILNYNTTYTTTTNSSGKITSKTPADNCFTGYVIVPVSTNDDNCVFSVVSSEREAKETILEIGKKAVEEKIEEVIENVVDNVTDNVVENVTEEVTIVKSKSVFERIMELFKKLFSIFKVK